MRQTTEILKDTFGRQHNYLRISLIEKCNLRCTYCMPEEGVLLSPKSSLMTSDEIIAIAKIFVANGVDKIRLTGGEPLLRKDFSYILEGLSKLPISLTLTTNGILIDRFLKELKTFGVKEINVSLDTLNPQKFASITKRNQFQKALDNIELLLKSGFLVKLNVVLIKGFNDCEIIDFIKLTQNTNLDVRFIEFMPFDGNNWNKEKLVTQHQILNIVKNHFGRDNNIALMNAVNFTARSYQIKGFLGQYGIISSVSNPFCDGCNRIRLTANGKIKNCLFSNLDTDILTQFRKGLPIEDIIQKALFKKKKTRAGLSKPLDFENPKNHRKNRSMITIGG